MQKKFSHISWRLNCKESHFLVHIDRLFKIDWAIGEGLIPGRLECLLKHWLSCRGQYCFKQIATCHAVICRETGKDNTTNLFTLAQNITMIFNSKLFHLSLIILCFCISRMTFSFYSPETRNRQKSQHSFVEQLGDESGG